MLANIKQSVKNTMDIYRSVIFIYHVEHQIFANYKSSILEVILIYLATVREILKLRSFLFKREKKRLDVPA